MISPTPCSLREGQQPTSLTLRVLKVDSTSPTLIMAVALRDGTLEQAALFMTVEDLVVITCPSEELT